MPRPIIIICIDGFDPDYLEAAEMPNLREIGRKGFMTTGRSMMPSVTNVNNVSIVTASYPARARNLLELPVGQGDGRGDSTSRRPSTSAP